MKKATPFDLIDRLTTWFLRSDRDITLPAGRKIVITQGNVTLSNGNLVITGNITITGTVDGVDVSTHAGNANAHHARQHALDSSSDHTGTLPWASVSKTGSNLSDLATRAHSSLTGIGADDHHARQHTYDSTSDHSGTLSWSKVSKTGSNLADLATRAHSDLSGLTSGDPHTQYHNNTRGDARYYQKTEFTYDPGTSSAPLATNSGGLLNVYGLGVGTWAAGAGTFSCSGNGSFGGRLNVGQGVQIGGTGANPTAGRVQWAESSAPSTPPSGNAVVYFKTDGRMYYKNDGGTEYGPL